MNMQLSSLLSHSLVIQVLQLWGDLLLRLNAIKACRELVEVTGVALTHSPAFERDTAGRSSVGNWRRDFAATLPRESPACMKAEGELTLEDYSLLCSNKFGLVSFRSSADLACSLCLQAEQHLALPRLSLRSVLLLLLLCGVIVLFLIMSCQCVVSC